MEFKNFRSEKGTIQVSSTTGHSATIGKDFMPIPEVLWGQAYTLGAIPEDVVSKTDATKEFIKEELAKGKEIGNKIKEANKQVLYKIYDEPLNYLNAKGEVIFRNVYKLFDNPITQLELAALWNEVLKERGKKK